MPIRAIKSDTHRLIKRAYIVRFLPTGEADEVLYPCDRCKTIKFHFVPPEGSKTPILYVVGEAPGEEEAKLLRPFIGKTGMALRHALIQAGVDLDLIRIFNSVACRPMTPEGANRTPTLQESLLCSNYVKEDIADKKPKAILLLGRVALRAFFGQFTFPEDPNHAVSASTVPLKRIVGRQLDWDGIPLFVTWHPSYICRKGEKSSPDYGDWVEHMAMAYKAGLAA